MVQAKGPALLETNECEPKSLLGSKSKARSPCRTDVVKLVVAHGTIVDLGVAVVDKNAAVVTVVVAVVIVVVVVDVVAVVVVLTRKLLARPWPRAWPAADT